MWFVKLPWKLRTIMCFCHSIFIFKIIPIFKIIFIFEIILVFKIMIVIRFQIWFLINSNFKEENEFDWNLVSHTRRDSGTINTDLRVLKKKRGGQFERNPKRQKKKPRRRPLPETYKKRKKDIYKKMGACGSRCGS